MMNWVGGARKRIKLNDEKKQQEAFFKQRRIDAALKKYKPQASSVNAELSQDVLNLKFIQKQFSNINNNSTVAEKVIQPGYDPSLRGTPARRVVADQNAVFPDQINKQYNNRETVDYSNISKNHNWQNQSSPHLPKQCQSILKTTATSTLITVEKRSVKKSVTFHDTLIHSSQAPSPMKPYSAHVYEIPDGENQSFS